ncbi:MAG: nucleotidyl transferase AbiEii/AbiGii toxin family protein [Bacteroidales bacterium]|nr:nucleotidyl transferase AbiEii/AbiGii toxin family protein [Bacteroidales bacterium]
MIPQQYITEWSEIAPWKANEQVEQDLIICRSLVELFSDEFIAEKLAFRGGTALHKLFLEPQSRYSEDIDLVQISVEPFGPSIDKIRKLLSFLGEPKIKQKNRNTTMIFNFESEIQPVQVLKLKVETNCREHFSVFNLKHKIFKVNSPWFSGECNITTYEVEELLGTKLRALYQRKKGRDLFDLFKALKTNDSLSKEKIIQVFQHYMKHELTGIPPKDSFLKNLEDKMNNPEFLGDTTALLRPDETYDPIDGFALVRKELIEKM